MLEVEMKFRCPDLAALEQRVTRLGGRLIGVEEQADEYFAHPSVDFAATDQALRLRTSADSVLLCYKGPKLPTATALGTKTREELETPITPTSAATLRLTLLRLGFVSRAVVRKRRRSFGLSGAQEGLTVVLDEVDDVGQFVEVETLAEPAQMPAARDAILALARQLDLTDAEPRSYLSMLLQLRSP